MNAKLICAASAEHLSETDNGTHAHREDSLMRKPRDAIRACIAGSTLSSFFDSPLAPANVTLPIRSIARAAV
ncbi:hypothetical protein GCM10022293_19170 [Azospirillum formosense]